MTDKQLDVDTRTPKEIHLDNLYNYARETAEKMIAQASTADTTEKIMDEFFVLENVAIILATRIAFSKSTYETRNNKEQLSAAMSDKIDDFKESMWREYDVVQYLIKNGGLKFKEAPAQAPANG